MRALFVALALSLAVAPACAKSERPSTQEGAIDEVLLAYLSIARSLHHEADLKEDANDVPGAIAALERLLAKPRPRNTPEIDEVVADTHARLGDLRSRQGDFDAAADHVSKGLSASPGTSYFRGHLLEVRGMIEERRAKSLADKGDAPGATAAKASAMKAYEEAIAVQDEVIKKATADGGTK